MATTASSIVCVVAHVQEDLLPAGRVERLEVTGWCFVRSWTSVEYKDIKPMIERDTLSENSRR